LEDCIFCKIVEKKIPTKLLLETDSLLAFADLHPKAPTHILFIPKKHIASLDSLLIEDSALIGEIFFSISKFAKEHSLSTAGYRVVNNMGRDGGQTVQHIHFHLLAGRKLNWPPG
jgi:histidine triad (HIT) family protein